MTPESTGLESLHDLLERCRRRFWKGTARIEAKPAAKGVQDSSESGGDCGCQVVETGTTLTVDASECPHDGALVQSTACRSTVITACATTDPSTLVVTTEGLEHQYPPVACKLFAAAGRFLALLDDRNPALAADGRTDPLGLVDTLTHRIGDAADIAASSGLLEAAASVEGYADLEPAVGFPIGHYAVQPGLGTDAQLSDVRTLETGSTARIYRRTDRVPLYALEVIETTLEPAARLAIVDAYEAIATGVVDGNRDAVRAIEHVLEEPPAPILAEIVQKHTRGYGLLEDLFADPRITDVYVTAPVDRNPIRVVCDGTSMTTNLSLTRAGGGTLASRIRRTSGRAFSRASPTVDATVELANGVGVRVAGVGEPVTDGVAFAFRERADDRFTLPGLIANGTMTAAAAGFLSVAIERNAATLIAGTRGAGKTTLLGTLLYELPPSTRTVVIEDTPELPVGPLQRVGRDVQALRTGTDNGPEITAADALRTALRLGDGALVVGEIRGKEARVLYEAMRVGANANAVLGTIHGDGADDVYERVVSDLGVEPSSFGATDLVVTTQAAHMADGKRRYLARVEEVCGQGDETWFEPLYTCVDSTQATPTGRVDRGESRLLERLTRPGETYADIRRALERRSRLLDELAADGRTSPADVAAAAVEHRLEANPTDERAVSGLGPEG